MSVKDTNHPKLHDTGIDKAIPAIIGIFRKWLALQPDGTGDLFCEHGCYTGRNLVLAYLCPMCNHDGALSFPSRNATLDP